MTGGTQTQHWWAWHVSNRAATWEILAGLEGLLPSRTNSNVSGFGFMDSPKAQGGSAQAVEAWQHDLSQPSKAWRYSRGGSTGGCRRQALVALQSIQLTPRANSGLLRKHCHTQTHMTSTSRTARCGPACRVVWQGRSLTPAPYADLTSKTRRLPVRGACLGQWRARRRVRRPARRRR